MQSLDILVTNVWRFFKSLKLTIALLTLILASSAVGTLVVQTSQSDAPLEAIYPQSVIRIFSLLGMFDLYHSWWFILLLFLFFLNLLICTLDGIPRFYKLYKANIVCPSPDKEGVNNYYFKKISIQNTEKLQAFFQKKSHGFLPDDKAAFNTVFYKITGKLSYFNVVLVHSGILILMVGALFGAIFGYNGKMSLQSGQTSNTVIVPQGDDKILSLPMPFSVRLENFNVEYYNNETKDRPKQYSSTLDIIKRGETVLKTQIQVNKPFTYEGLNLYQASFTEDNKLNFELYNAQTGERIQTTLGMREKGTFANTTVSIIPVQFEPDFKMDGHDKSLGPAVFVHALTSKNMSAPFWILKNYPEFGPMLDKNFRLVLKDTQTSYGSVLDISKNPGVEVILAGALLLTFGFFLVAFFKFTKYWVVFNKDDSSITLIAYSKHLPSNAQFAFNKIIALLERNAL